MKLKIIKYDGTDFFCNVLSFEFRTNQVTNWIKAKLIDDKKLLRMMLSFMMFVLSKQ